MIGQLLRYSICCFPTNTVYQCVICQLNTIPSFIAIHGIIAAANGCYLSNFVIEMMLQFGDETQPAFGIAYPFHR